MTIHRAYSRIHYANAYSAEREMTASACPRSMAGFDCQRATAHWPTYNHPRPIQSSGSNEKGALSCLPEGRADGTMSQALAAARDMLT